MGQGCRPLESPCLASGWQVPLKPMENGKHSDCFLEVLAPEPDPLDQCVKIGLEGLENTIVPLEEALGHILGGHSVHLDSRRVEA